MKFNEKLIELRKRAGLSQEELGYKLNVTRQTVSKWELGQTTPEMDKLAEMAKIFNVSVDELINEAEVTQNVNPIIEDKPIQDKKTKRNTVRIIIVGLLVFVIIAIVVKMFLAFTAMNIVNQAGKQATGLFDKIFTIFNKTTDGEINNEDDVVEKIENIFGGITDKIKVSEFNNGVELYAGSQKGMRVISLLDKIITSNKTQERKITVQYNGVETQDENEIKNIKRNFDTFDNCEITYEYDAEGFINKAIIEKL